MKRKAQYLVYAGENKGKRLNNEAVDAIGLFTATEMRRRFKVSKPQLDALLEYGGHFAVIYHHPDYFLVELD